MLKKLSATAFFGILLACSCNEVDTEEDARIPFSAVVGSDLLQSTESREELREIKGKSILRTLFLHECIDKDKVSSLPIHVESMLKQELVNCFSREKAEMELNAFFDGATSISVEERQTFLFVYINEEGDNCLMMIRGAKGEIFEDVQGIKSVMGMINPVIRLVIERVYGKS